jgi:hypothetical protein
MKVHEEREQKRARRTRDVALPARPALASGGDWSLAPLRRAIIDGDVACFNKVVVR